MDSCKDQLVRSVAADVFRHLENRIISYDGVIPTEEYIKGVDRIKELIQSEFANGVYVKKSDHTDAVCMVELFENKDAPVPKVVLLATMDTEFMRREGGGLGGFGIANSRVIQTLNVAAVFELYASGVTESVEILRRPLIDKMIHPCMRFTIHRSINADNYATVMKEIQNGN